MILAFDVSSSMKAKDLTPTRMAAAKKAARTFVADQPSSIRIGVVAFSDAGYVVQPPTRSKRDVLDAIDRLSPKGGTALGRGHPHVARRGRGEAPADRPDRARGGNPTTRCPVPRLGRDHPALRRRQHRRARSAGARAGRRAGRRAHLRRSASAVRTARWSTSTASRWRPSSTPTSARRRGGQRRHVLRRPRCRRVATGLRLDRPEAHRRRARRPRSPRSSPASDSCCSSSPPGSRCGGTGG